MKIEGRRHCGYITYEADIDPDKILICHCTDCQALSVFSWAHGAFWIGSAIAILAKTSRR